MVILNTPDDCAWLREIHLGNDCPVFHSAILEGNEDAPDKVTLYFSADPLYTDEPVAVYVTGWPEICGMRRV